MELTILMPCLNEAETLATCIHKAQSFLTSRGIDGEVLIADNGSTDGSLEIAQRLGVRVINVPIKGYGAALWAGINAAQGQYVIMGDADDSYDFAELDPFVAKLHEGYDLVMGNRFWGGIQPGAMPPLHQYLGNPVLSTIGRILYGSSIRDFHCGLRGFRRQAMIDLDLHTTGMEFASEMVVRSTLEHLRITEVPTVLYPDGRSRPPHLRSWRDGWRHLRFLLLYAPRWLWLYPGVLSVLLGVTIMLWLLPGPRQVGRITFDIHSLLYATIAVILGVQAIQFYLSARVFAASEGLMPDDPLVDWFSRHVPLGAALVCGIGMALIGFWGSLAAAYSWSRMSFPDLNASVTMRSILPSLLLLTVGAQIVFGGLFLSLLSVKRR